METLEDRETGSTSTEDGHPGDDGVEGGTSDITDERVEESRITVEESFRVGPVTVS